MNVCNIHICIENTCIHWSVILLLYRRRFVAGFVPSSPPISHCMQNGEWSIPEFKCIGKLLHRFFTFTFFAR